jgi:hypothetical protein
VYLYKIHGTDYPEHYERFKHGGDVHEFDLSSGTPDYYSLPNLVATMRTNRYSLVDEIMATKLLKLSDVIKNYNLGQMDYFTRKEVNSKNVTA